MGGKQKRAAKYKKWLEAQNHQNQLKHNGQGDGAFSSGMDGDSPGGPAGPIPYEAQQELLRHRGRKGKKPQRNATWILRRLGHLANSWENFPSWPWTILVTLFLTILTFVLIRSLIQMFVPQTDALDRSALYNGLKMGIPRPLYKFIRVVDYAFTSPEINWDGIQRIMYAPEDYYPTRRQ